MKLHYIVITAVVLLLLLALTRFYWPNLIIPSDTGVVDGQLQPLRTSPNGVASDTDQTGKRVEAFPILGSVAMSFDKLEQVARNYGRVQVVTRTERYLHLVMVTPRMGYRDDLEWLATDDGRLAFRSQSRIGHGDMGLNRSRYDSLMAAYRAGADL